MHTGFVHLLTLSEPVNLGKTLGILGAGQWLCHDLNAFEIARLAPRGAAKISQYTIPYQPAGEWTDIPDEVDRAKRPMLIMRSGAIGDLLLLNPALLQMNAESDGDSEFHLCCFPHHFSIFENCAFIDKLVSYPFCAEDAHKYRAILSLENTMECDHSQHATDVFAKALGLTTPLADYRPVYHVADAEKEVAQKHLFQKRPNLAIQVRASVANRDYPMPQWLEVIKKLEQRGWGILLLGSKGQVPPLAPPDQSPFIRNLAEEGLTFRESAAVLSQCQAFVGVDSAWAHMCHALDIPAVVLFGAFSWETRTSKAPKTIALSGVGECAPCNWHMHAGRAFPPNKPCSKQQLCVVLASIEPERIVAKVDALKP
ncbi:MAG TPA: glycosyltransferase family 9 protein [Bacteroidia bacterium]|nr:glycosyltransferase family 9 protein [Bacteroidia bacterium]